MEHDLFSLEESKFWGYLVALEALKDEYQQDGEGLLTDVHSGRTRENGCKRNNGGSE